MIEQRSHQPDGSDFASQAPAKDHPSKLIAFWNIADSKSFQSLIQRVSAKFTLTSTDYGNLSDNEFRKRGRFLLKRDKQAGRQADRQTSVAC